MACTKEEIISLYDRIMACCNRLNKKLDEYGEFPSSFHEQPVLQQPYGHPALVEVGFHPPHTQPPEPPDWQRPYRPHVARQPDKYPPPPPYQPEPPSDLPATFVDCHTTALLQHQSPNFCPQPQPTYLQPDHGMPRQQICWDPPDQRQAFATTPTRYTIAGYQDLLPEQPPQQHTYWQPNHQHQEPVLDQPMPPPSNTYQPPPSPNTYQPLPNCLEEQRIADEKNGHFMGDRNQILSTSDRFAAPVDASPSIVTDPMAAHSRVSLANHKAKALLSKNLVAILDEGGGEMNAENFGNLDCSKTSYFQIQNEEGRFDYHRLHAAENKGRIVASRGGADSNSNLSNIREFNDNGELALGDPQSAEKDGSIMASHGGTFPHSSSCIILENDKEITAGASIDLPIINGRGLGKCLEGNVDLADFEMIENFAVNKGDNLLSNYEENMQLDLVEGRSLAVHQITPAPTTGPPQMGSMITVLDQVSSLAGPNLISPPNNPTQIPLPKNSKPPLPAHTRLSSRNPPSYPAQ